VLRSMREIERYELTARDGVIGHCKDFLFDDRDWRVRHMVANTGHWLPGRKVLIPPEALGEPSWEERRFPVDLTKEEIRHAPPLDEDAPVSRRYEEDLFEYHGWAFYWTVGVPWGPRLGATTDPESDTPLQREIDEAQGTFSDLRSERELVGYEVDGADRKVGHIVDLIVDDTSWRVRYVVVDTGSWLSGRHVLIPPTWLTSFDWASRRVRTELRSEAIEGSPKYDPSAPVNREYEIALYDYYGRPVYWEE
jgi:hypothetical protein